MDHCLNQKSMPTLCRWDQQRQMVFGRKRIQMEMVPSHGRSSQAQKEILLRPQGYNQNMFVPLYILLIRVQTKEQKDLIVFSLTSDCLCFPGFRYTLIAPSLVQNIMIMYVHG